MGKTNLQKLARELQKENGWSYTYALSQAKKRLEDIAAEKRELTQKREAVVGKPGTREWRSPHDEELRASTYKLGDVLRRLSDGRTFAKGWESSYGTILRDVQTCERVEVTHDELARGYELTTQRASRDFAEFASSEPDLKSS